MKVLPLSLLLVIVSVVTVQGLAIFTWNDRCLRAQEACMKLDYQEARRLTSEERRHHPENLIPLYIDGKTDFLQAFLLEEDSLIEFLKRRNVQRIALLEKGNPKDPYRRLCIAELHLHQAAARIKSQEFFGAVYDLRKANSLLLENRKAFPEFKPNLLGLGFIHCVTGAIPKNYQWLAGLLGFNGTVAGGLAEIGSLLASCTANNSIRYLYDETLLCMTFLELSLYPKLDHSRQLARFSPVDKLNHKPLVIYAKGAVYAASAENDSVISLINRYRSEPGNQPFKFLHMMEGNARLYKLDPTAEQCFLRFLRHKGGKTYKHSILQRLAWTRLIQNDRQGYRKYLGQMASLANSGHMTDEDRSAITEWKSGQDPNPILLRARLLFDGGYYENAFDLLAGQPIEAYPRFRDQLEFTYRLARIYDKQGKHEQAIQLYESTLNIGADHSFYFAANSALHLGQLYESLNNTTKAKAYYNKTLELRDHEFQNSIDQKAKAGLSRLSR